MIQKLKRRAALGDKAMAKEAFGFVQGVNPEEKGRTLNKGPFTITEEIEPVGYLYNCTALKRSDGLTAPTVYSTLRLSEEEVEARFAEFMAAHQG